MHFSERCATNCDHSLRGHSESRSATTQGEKGSVSERRVHHFRRRRVCVQFFGDSRRWRALCSHRQRCMNGYPLDSVWYSPIDKRYCHAMVLLWTPPLLSSSVTKLPILRARALAADSSWSFTIGLSASFIAIYWIFNLSEHPKRAK